MELQQELNKGSLLSIQISCATLVLLMLYLSNVTTEYNSSDSAGCKLVNRWSLNQVQLK